MTEYCLEQLQAAGAVVVEGSFTANPYFAPLLAGISGGRQVFCSEDGSGTTVGGWMLRHWFDSQHEVRGPQTAVPLHLRGLESYRRAWRHALTALSCPEGYFCG